MYDVEQHSFCEILDKMTNPVLRAEKNTQERIQSHSFQLFYVLSQVQDLSGQSSIILG